MSKNRYLDGAGTGGGGGGEEESPWLAGEDDEKDEGKNQHKE